MFRFILFDVACFLFGGWFSFLKKARSSVYSAAALVKPRVLIHRQEHGDVPMPHRLRHAFDVRPVYER